MPTQGEPTGPVGDLWAEVGCFTARGNAEGREARGWKSGWRDLLASGRRQCREESIQVRCYYSRALPSPQGPHGAAFPSKCRACSVLNSGVPLLATPGTAAEHCSGPREVWAGLSTAASPPGCKQGLLGTLGHSCTSSRAPTSACLSQFSNSLPTPAPLPGTGSGVGVALGPCGWP